MKHMKHVKNNNSQQKIRKTDCPRLLELPHDFSWKLLDACLDDLQDLIRLEPATSDFVVQARRAIRSRKPELYHKLEDDWSLQRINSLGRGLQHASVAAVRLVASLMQKCPDIELNSPSVRREQCLLNAIKVDDELKSFDLDDRVIRRIQIEILLLLGEEPDLEEVLLGAKHGPGTSLFGDFSESAGYFKYLRWPYLVTDDARSLLRTAIESDQRWHNALEDSFRQRYSIEKWRIVDQAVFWENVFMPVSFNKIAVVPKDGRKDRPIAIEPVGSMYLQLGVDRVLRDRLRTCWNMDLSDALKNRAAAREGSTVTSALSPATLDLSNASDTVSLFAIQKFLPVGWVRLLCSLRSRFGLLPSGDAIVYKKISSMGNGYTFALESVFFMAILRAVSAEYGDVTDKLLAYGDDLAFPRYLAPMVVFYLSHVGCKVNMKKTFHSGPVRESCGEDYYDGVNIRPVYLKGIDDIADLVSFRNKLCEWRYNLTGEYSMPKTESFLFRFYGGEALIGPWKTTAPDSAWINDPYMSVAEFSKIQCFQLKAPDPIRGRNFLLGRLVHDLYNCELESPRFEIRERGRGTVVLSGYTVVFLDHYIPKRLSATP